MIACGESGCCLPCLVVTPEDGCAMRVPHTLSEETFPEFEIVSQRDLTVSL